jgi:transcriptional regulator with XRE-family HTH domain/tetratricopeptide (TPR) repeat protein
MATASSTFGALLRGYRLAAGLTQEALAERAGISARAVGDLERDAARSPRLDSVALLATALGLAPAEHRALLAAARPFARPAHSPPAVPTPLVGRGREQALLRDQFEATLSARGGLVLIGGEAGLGKTALAEALCAEAAGQGALVLVGRCYDLSETPPYGPWREMFARAPRDTDLPVLPAAVLPPNREGESAASQEVIFARLSDYLAALAARRPLVVLLEDLHWADPASLDLLRTLGRQLVDLPILLLATYRADELTHGHPLYQLLPLLVREARASRLDLLPLQVADLEALVRGRYGLPPADMDRLVAYLSARAEGNPFYAGELLRALEEGGSLRRAGSDGALGDLAGARVPPLLRQVIDGRVARLDAEAQGLLAVAAIIGQEIPLTLWGTVGEVAESGLLDVIEQAVAAHLLAEAPDGTQVHFVHALIREALYEGQPPTRRRGWHQRVGEALAATPNPDPDAVAYQFRQAGDARAVPWLLRAGARALRTSAHAMAAARFAAALTLLPDDGTLIRERGWLRYRVATSFYDDPRFNIAALDALVPVAGDADDPYLAAYVEYMRGMLRCVAGDYRRGLDEMRAGVARLGALSPVEHIRLAALGDFAVAPALYDESNPAGALVLHLAGAGRLAEALALGEAHIAGTGGARRAVSGDAQFGLGHVYAFLGRPEAARGAYAQARVEYRAIGDEVQVAHAFSGELNLVLMPYRADHPDEHLRLLAEAGQPSIALARELGGRPFPGLARLWVQLLEGRWAEVRALATVARADRGPFALAVAVLARAQGDLDLAWRVVRERLPDGPASVPGEGRFRQALVAQPLAAALALDANDLVTARAWLTANDRWLAWSGSVLYRAEGQLGWAMYYRTAGNPTLAHRHAAQALAHASGPRQPLALLATQRLLGELATDVGHHTEAAAHLDQALALADACAAPYERALTLLAVAESLVAAGRYAPAAAPLGEARTVFADLGAMPALARASALATRLAANT